MIIMIVFVSDSGFVAAAVCGDEHIDYFLFLLVIVIVGILQGYVVQKEWYGNICKKMCAQLSKSHNSTIHCTVKDKNFKLDLHGVFS